MGKVASAASPHGKDHIRLFFAMSSVIRFLFATAKASGRKDRLGLEIRSVIPVVPSPGTPILEGAIHREASCQKLEF